MKPLKLIPHIDILRAILWILYALDCGSLKSEYAMRRDLSCRKIHLRTMEEYNRLFPRKRYKK